MRQMYPSRRLSLMRPRTPPVLLCADFDETITLRDTISLLFQLAKSSSTQQQQLVAQYESESSAFLRHHETKWQRCHSRDFDGAGLREFLEGYAATDLRSLQRVVDSCALRGIRREKIAIAARHVQVRAGCVETLRTASAWKVISANWSEQLVTSVLQNAGLEVQSTQIIANELKMERAVSTGDIEMQVQSPMDKEGLIAKLRKEAMVVYVGDSANDLLAMLEAHVGVWLAATATSSSAQLLHRLVETYGVDVCPLTEYKSLVDCKDAACASKRAGDKPVLFTMTDWSQLRTLVEALDGQSVKLYPKNQ